MPEDSPPGRQGCRNTAGAHDDHRLSRDSHLPVRIAEPGMTTTFTYDSHGATALQDHDRYHHHDGALLHQRYKPHLDLFLDQLPARLRQESLARMSRL